MTACKLLPGTGRAIMRSMVEGDSGERRPQPHSPSTTGYAGGPPPRSGEDR